MSKRIILLALSILFIPAISMPSAEAADIILKIAPDQLTGYDRSLFKLWVDTDKNGCDTRKEVLIQEAVTKPKIGKGCKLIGGRWISPYDQKTYTDSSLLDIDHVVPLSEAWRSGAWQWTSDLRQQYANELREPAALAAVSLSLNRQKGDKDVAQWLPPKNICKYVADWIVVKATYSLTVDPQEAVVLKSYIFQCLYTNVFFSDSILPTPSPSPSATSTPTPTPTPTPVPTATSPIPIFPTPSPTPTQSNNSSSVAAPTTSPTPTQSSTTNSVTEQSTTTQTITPGAFCSPAGATGTSSKGVTYTCKTSATDSKNRWRQ